MKRVNNATTVASKPSTALAAFQAAYQVEQLANSGSQIFGISTPIYDMSAYYGVPRIVNDINGAFGSYADIKAALKSDLDAAFSVSEFDGRDVYTLAVKDGEGIHYFSLQHDKDGDPITEGELILAKVVLNRSFEVPDTDVILEKGRVMFKALPVDYALKLKKAA